MVVHSIISKFAIHSRKILQFRDAIKRVKSLSSETDNQ
ncbi:hypothetical protein Agau_L100773 [Agrobacterium tumefaciens F2]|nr:hypothetical protein Agau_L100773 [Agrobacterium tumefaciens F2]